MDRAAIIYVVDDDDSVRESVCMLLEAYGFSVRGFAAAGAFLENTRGEGADFFLFDMHMPGMNGLELLELLRGRGIRTPAAILTGRFDSELLPRVKRVGCAVVMQKPLETEMLLSAIRAKQPGAGVGKTSHT